MLDVDYEPVGINNPFAVPARKKQMDEVCIIHYPNQLGFTPIVLGPKYIESESSWGISQFFKELCWISKNYEKGRYIDCADSDFPTEWGIEIKPTGRISWGCRAFTIRQVRLIKKQMEINYSKKQLLGN